MMNLNKVTLKEPSILVVRNHDIQALFMGYSIKRVKGISWSELIYDLFQKPDRKMDKSKVNQDRSG